MRFACGYAGCDGYAAALAAGEETKTNKCIAGGQEVARQIAQTMGLAFEPVAEVNAFLHCRGNCHNTRKKVDFQGARSCAAAKLLFGSDGACHYGCIGYGDCIGVSVAGAVAHNLGQILAAVVLLETSRLVWRFPVLCLSGLAAGVCIGLMSALLIRRVKM